MFCVAPSTLKATIKSQLADEKLRSSLCSVLKNALNEQLSSTQAWQEHLEKVINIKNELRQELVSAYGKLTKVDAFEEKVNEMISMRFNEGNLEEWSNQDEEGFVHGWPDRITVSTVVENDNSYIINRSDSFDKSELALLLRLKRFYEQYSGSENTKLLAFTGFISSSVMEIAEQKGVEVIVVSS